LFSFDSELLEIIQEYYDDKNTTITRILR